MALDLGVRYVGELPNQRVPQYFTGDVHFGWQPTPALEVAVYGRNLFEPRHPEFGQPASRREVPRSVFGKVTCRF
jgi:iron complex outermembrane receptor protein